MAELRATPQSPALGRIAAALRKAQEFAGQYQVLPQVPLLGGTGVDELLGLPGAAREVENWSYGNYPVRINPNAGRTASFIPEVKPGRKSDLADTMLLGLDVAPLAGLAGKGVVKGAKALEDATVGAVQRGRIRAAAAKVPQDTAYDPLRQRMEERGALMYAVKPKGGNWMEGSVDEVLSPFRIRDTRAPYIGQDPAERLRDMETSLAQNIESGVPVDMDYVQGERARLASQVAINKWIDTKLNKYMRNEMATPDDPLKALADRGVLHFAPREIRDESPAMARIRERRERGGFPLEDTATTPLGQQWERYADNAINTVPSQIRLAQLKLNGGVSDQARLAENPWLEKLPRDTPVSSPDYASILSNEGVGFEHLIDELKNAMDPNSTLPRNLRLDPKDIDKITVPQAVERVAKINAWRAEEAARAEKAGMLENLQATPRMADEGLELSFVDKPGGAWVDIPETVDEKGMKLCTSIGKAGGWCTQHESAATSYGSGENRLTALVDTEGRPHAQAKISTPSRPATVDEIESLIPQAEEIFNNLPKYDDRLENPDLKDSYIREIASNLARKSFSPDITELKPPGNSFDSERAREYIRRDPQYKQKVTESVLKFLNGGEWGRAKDLHHYGIVDLKNPDSLVDAMKTLYGDESSRRVGQEFVDAFNMAVDAQPDAPRFMTQRQLREFIGPVEPLQGYAGGGLVKGAVKSIGELVQKYIAKEAPEAAVTAAPKEQKMLQGFYRGYAGDYDAARAAAQDAGVFVSPQRAVGEYYANKRAAQTGAEPHLEMILADPFAGRGYGHSTMGTGKNPPMITRARELAPEDVKNRTKLYAEGGAVADTDVKNWFAANPGATDYDIAAAMKKYDVAPEQVSRVTGVGMPEVQQRYAIARPKTDEEVKQFLTSQPGMTDPQIANAMRMYNVAPEQVSRAINMGLPEVKLRYAFASPPPQPQPAPSGGRGDPMRDLNNIASAYSIGTYFIPGMQAMPIIDYGLRALSLGNTIKDIGKKLGFAAGGPVNYDPTEIDTIVSRVKEELHG